MVCTLHDLSTELIIKICMYLEVKDLCRFKQTCKRFSEIIATHGNVICKNVVVTNQVNNKFLLRCYRRLTTIDKLRISYNWTNGKYFEKTFLKSKQKFMPYINLTNEHLWISRGDVIKCFNRKQSNLNIGNPSHIFQAIPKVDFVNFQLKNNFLVAGLRNGHIYFKNIIKEDNILASKNCHDSDVHSVDINHNIDLVVSGSRDGELKLWNVENSVAETLVYNTGITLPDLIWKTSFSEDNKCAVATAGNIYRKSLFVYNVERLENPLELSANNNTAGVSDVRWDSSNNTLFSCGYDSYVRQWDIRTGKCEQEFLDPCCAALYCLDYDYHNTILTGAQFNGRITLWDTRKTTAAQIYFLASCNDFHTTSPVYNLAFDADSLFAATDRNLNVLDFYGQQTASKNYEFFISMKSR